MTERISQTTRKVIAALLIVMVALCAVPASPAAADSAGPNYPTVGVNVSTGSAPDWIDPNNISSDNDVYTSVSSTADTTTDLLAGGGFAFNIPENATINGIELTIGRYTTLAPTGGGARDYGVYLAKNGVRAGANRGYASQSFDWPATEAPITYGAPNDLWDTTWTPAEINADGFGAILWVRFAGTATGFVDYFRITVTYTLSGLTPTTMSATAVSGDYGSQANLSATLTSGAPPSPVIGKTVNFTLNGSAACSSTTDASGVATCPADLLEDVGVYATGVGASFLGDASYASSSASASLTITPKPITVTADAKTKVYGSPDPALTYAVAPALLAGDSFTGALARTGTENVGDYTILQASLSAGSNYTITYTGAAFSITPLSVAVTAAAKTKVYGVADPALTYTTVPPLIGSDTLPGNLTRTGTENVGVYAIEQSTLNGGTNYTITSFTGAAFTITPKPITVTADAKTKVYGAVDPALTYTVAPALITGDSFTGALTRTAGENVNTYAILQSNLSAGTNYTITYAGAAFTITPKPITVTADAKTKVYGAVDPALTYTAVPALNTGDSFTGALIRTAGENVNTYAILQGNLSAGTNYAITYAGAAFTITPKPITVTAAAKTKVYGAVDPALTYTAVPALNTGDSFTGALIRNGTENVGTYAILQGNLSAGTNYAITYTGAAFSITPLPITVTAAAKTKVYGTIDPALTYITVPPLIGSDTLPGNLIRTGTENVGVYAIEQGTLNGGTNYSITSFTGAAFTITIANQTITVTTHAPASATNGSSFTVAANSSSGLAVAYSSSGVCTNVGPVFTMTSAAGTCTVHYNQPGNTNYNPADEVTETVQATEGPVITLQPVSVRVLSGNDATFTAAATGNPAPTVQWQYSTDDGDSWDDLPGEIFTTLTITTPPLSSNGYQYRAVFTNASGSSTTNAATLHLLYDRLFLPTISR